MEILDKEVKEFFDKRNHQKIHEFEGFSPYQMNNILYSSFSLDSIITVNHDIDTKILDEIGFLVLTEHFLNLIYEQKEIKLTSRGYLPVLIVKELYNQKFVIEDEIESGIFKLTKELDSMIITLLRIVTNLARLTKVRKNKLSLTKKGEQILQQNRSDLLTEILHTFCYKYNWAYFDGYGNEQFAQIGFGFSIFLILNYGERFRNSEFYLEKYLNAFPVLIEQFEIPDNWNNISKVMKKCYTLRTFERFLSYFNFIEMREVGIKFESEVELKKSDILNKVIKVII